MARLPRLVLPGHLHLVVHTAQPGRNVFPGPADRQRFLDALRDAAHDAEAAVHAYGLFDEEVRLLATPTTPHGLATMLQSVNRRYVPYLNRAVGSRGSPWQGRFRSAVVDPARHFRAVLRFVETGPSADGGHLGGDHTSVRHHLGLEIQPVVVDHPAMWNFGNTPFEREAAYARHLADDVDRPMAAILRAALSGWVVGDDAFTRSLEGIATRRLDRRSPGRPRQEAIDVSLNIESKIDAPK